MWHTACRITGEAKSGGGNSRREGFADVYVRYAVKQMWQVIKLQLCCDCSIDTVEVEVICFI